MGFDGWGGASGKSAEDFFKKVGVLSLMFFLQVVAFFFCTEKQQVSERSAVSRSTKFFEGCEWKSRKEYERNSSNSWIPFWLPRGFSRDLPLFCFDIFFGDNPFEALEAASTGFFDDIFSVSLH